MSQKGIFGMLLKDYHLNKFGYKKIKIGEVSVIFKTTREVSVIRLNLGEVSEIIPKVFLKCVY